MRVAGLAGTVGAMTTSLGTDRSRIRSRTPRLVVAILVVAVVATPVLAFPYVLLDRSGSRIDLGPSSGSAPSPSC